MTSTLKALCLDSIRSKILQRLELCLDILGGTVERISNTAEVLGAVHQEARVSRAVELMVSHVDNLKRRNERDTELDETKKLNRKILRRNYSDPRDEGEFRQKDNKTSQQLHIGASRRRVSIAVINKQAQVCAVQVLPLQRHARTHAHQLCLFFCPRKRENWKEGCRSHSH
ncbi:inositol 1,4,5-triphosphate receptor associated 2 [Oncorhynchus mykiss]|uniref:inositol 1,4,5-triphosphate receptor associated 2 n=1 Tax=Oncorhynchus mykiss TaxID=8022 RepID=UPI001877A547|nr:inositol 1,4,5-triphosphate receptor associated 2 [Oncorhynchus mykiss]